MTNVIPFPTATERQQPSIGVLLRGGFLMLDISLAQLAEVIRSCPVEHRDRLWQSHAEAESSLEEVRAAASKLML